MRPQTVSRALRSGPAAPGRISLAVMIKTEVSAHRRPRVQEEQSARTLQWAIHDHLRRGADLSRSEPTAVRLLVRWTRSGFGLRVAATTDHHTRFCADSRSPASKAIVVTMTPSAQPPRRACCDLREDGHTCRPRARFAPAVPAKHPNKPVTRLLAATGRRAGGPRCVIRWSGPPAQ